MPDGKLIASWEVHCASCSSLFLGIARTAGSAEVILWNAGWSKRRNLWICRRCKDSDGGTLAVVTGWAIEGPFGFMDAALYPHATEADGWWRAGFRSPDEIAEAKLRGARAFRCELRELAARREDQP